MQAGRCIATAATALALCACADEVVSTDEVYYDWDQRRVLCGVGLDDRIGLDAAELRTAMERARDRDEVLIFYAHDISERWASPERVEEAIAIAAELGLGFFTVPELHGAPPPDRAGVALTFDDAFIDNWHGFRDTFSRYGARATFYVTRFHRLNDERVAKLRELRDLGHAIESHGVNHLNAADYAEDLGVRAYVEDEVVPSLEAMRAAGFAPTSFAYPFGARTGALDRAILEHVDSVRSLSWLFASSGLVSDPCPE